MSGKGNTHLTFDGELTWAEFKKVVNLAGRGIPDTAMVTLTNNGSSNPTLVDQAVVVDWELSALDNDQGQAKTIRAGA
jgi:hypothetical protein